MIYKTSKGARNQAKMLLLSSLPGSSGGVKSNISRAEDIAEILFKKFNKVYPRGWQLKHLIQLRNVDLKHLAASTQYNYYMTVLKLLSALQAPEEWKGSLAGSWCRKDGSRKKIKRTGRPVKLAFKN